MSVKSRRFFLLASLAVYAAFIVAFVVFVFGPYLFVSKAPTCIAQLYGDYRVQVFATPANPAPGEEVELTAVVRTPEGKKPNARVAMSISKGLLPVHTSDPFESGNGIYTFYYTFDEAGEYLVSFIIIDKKGTTVVDASIVVTNPIPYENFIIPAAFLPIPAVIIFTAYFLTRQTPKNIN